MTKEIIIHIYCVIFLCSQCLLVFVLPFLGCMFYLEVGINFRELQKCLQLSKTRILIFEDEPYVGGRLWFFKRQSQATKICSISHSAGCKQVPITRRIYFIFHPDGQKYTLITKKNILHFPSPWMQKKKNIPILHNRVSFYGFLFSFFVSLTILAWRQCFGQMESNSVLKHRMTRIINLKLRKCLRWVSCPSSDF